MKIFKSSVAAWVLSVTLLLSGCNLIGDTFSIAEEMKRDPAITNWESAIKVPKWDPVKGKSGDIFNFGSDEYISVTGVVLESEDARKGDFGSATLYVTLDTENVDDFSDDFVVCLEIGSSSCTRGAYITAVDKQRVYFDYTGYFPVTKATVTVYNDDGRRIEVDAKVTK